MKRIAKSGFLLAARLGISMPAGSTARAASGYAWCSSSPNQDPTTWVWSKGVWRTHNHEIASHGPREIFFTPGWSWLKKYNADTSNWAAGVSASGTFFYSGPDITAYVTCEPH